MKGRTTLLLAVIFVGLLVYVFKFQRGEPRKERQIFGFSTEQVAKLELKYTDDEDTILLEKKGETWQILKPLRAKGNTEDVESIVSDFAGLESASTFEAGEAERLTSDLTGLDKPEFIAQAWDDRGRLLAKLALGNEAPVGSDVYAMVDDDYYITVASYSTTSLKKKADDLRDKSVLEIAEDDDVDAIEIQYAAHSVRIQRVDDEHWRLTKPMETDGDEWNCKDLLRAIKGLEAEEFVKKDESKTLADYGLDKPQLTATVTLKEGDNREQIVKLGSAVEDEIGRIYAAAEGRDEIFEVKDSILEDLRKEANDLRESELLDLMNSEVERLEIVNAGQEFSARRLDAGSWELEKPRKAPCDQTKIDDILWNATGLRADEFVAEKPESLAEWGLDKPQAKLTLTAESGTFEILLGDQKDDKVYAKRADQPNVVLVSDLLLKDLPRKVDDIIEQDETVEAPAAFELEEIVE